MGTRVKVGLGIVAAVVLVGAAGLWWFFRDDAPRTVNLENAVASVNETAASGDAVTGTDGTWRVDSTSGTFDYNSATGTFAGFRIQEKLASIGSTTAVGRTGDVTGTVTIADTTVTAATFSVDLTSITTNQSQRDSRVQQALATSRYPTATFTLTEPIALGDAAATGAKVSVTASGDLTIHGVTQRVEFPLEAQLTKNTIVVVGSIDVTFSDFGVSVPTSPAVVSVDDYGQLELQVLLTSA
jgi:polyisoprenoid-binding protein YceI